MAKPHLSSYQPLTEKHFSDRTWRRFTDYRHAAGLHLIPLTAPEVSLAAATLPLVFASAADKSFSLCLLTGLKAGHNHCLDARQQWQTGYVPAFLRSHPFRLLPIPDKPEERVLCVDTNSPWLLEGAKGSEEAFFSSQGQLNPFVDEIVKFLQELTRHYQLTQRAVNALVEHKLLMPWEMKDLDNQAIIGLQRIDEAALQKIDADTLHKLQRIGSLGIAYAQMLSTHQLPRLQELAQQQPDSAKVQELLEKLSDGDDSLQLF